MPMAVKTLFIARLSQTDVAISEEFVMSTIKYTPMLPNKKKNLSWQQKHYNHKKEETFPQTYLNSDIDVEKQIHE